MPATDVIIMGAGGRMGSTLVQLATADPELNLVAALERPELLGTLNGLVCQTGSNPEDILPTCSKAVIVDFTHPEATVLTAETAARHGNPMVIGTTGLNESQQQKLAGAAERIPLFWAPNMSVGINLLLEFLPQLARVLGVDYDVEISEIHHKHKKDAPSGTAVKLAQALSQAKGWDPGTALRACREGMIGARPEQEIGVQTLRGGDVVGEHTVYFFGPGERIDVTHRAYSRETFAKGALRAAKWLGNQTPGRLYSMADVFADAAQDR
jgi:4-hydroxy-tetrahydrodipicolinate reductase